MPIRGIVFDIGGVLEIMPEPWVNKKWEAQLNLKPGELDQRLITVWKGGSIGTITEEQVHQSIGEIMGWDVAQVNAFMDDVWVEYLGTLNVELTDYFKNLRPQYTTGILSNSFVGARKREQELYHFEDICDFIIYSHEVGMSKPNRGIYALTLERLRLEPTEVIFLDDRDGAIDAAHDFGIHGIVFKDNKQAIADIEACIRENA